VSSGDDDLDGVVARAVAGDEAAFHRLYVEVQPRLLRYLRATSPSLAEDVAAETWVEVVRRLSAFQGGAAQLRAWMFTIARSKVVDRLRYEQRHPVQLTADVAQVADSGASRISGGDVAELVERAASTAAALRLIATLPPHEAEVVALRVIAELDVATVSRMTGRSPVAVRVAAHRGLRRLAGRLAPQGTDSSEGTHAPAPASPGGAGEVTP
jgi:RNA polymerase sigma-70 factor (ECF subfamily)